MWSLYRAARLWLLSGDAEPGATVLAPHTVAQAAVPTPTVSGSAAAQATPCYCTAAVLPPPQVYVFYGVEVHTPSLVAVADVVPPGVSTTTGGAIVTVPIFSVITTALPPGMSGSTVVVLPPVMAVASGLSAPDIHATATVFAIAVLSQALVSSPAVSGSGSIITTAFEATATFVTQNARVGGLTALLYEFTLNDTAVYVLVAVDEIAYVLPLTPEVVINLVQRN